MNRQTITQLSPRERQVWSLAQSGQKRKLIARALGLSPSTVNAHLQKVRLKIKEDGTPEAALSPWIAVSERVPEEYGEYQIAMKDYVTCARFGHPNGEREEGFYVDGCRYEPTHWAPMLPHPSLESAHA